MSRVRQQPGSTLLFGAEVIEMKAPAPVRANDHVQPHSQGKFETYTGWPARILESYRACPATDLN